MNVDLAQKSYFLRLPPTGFLVVVCVLGLTLLGLVVLFSASQSMHENPAFLLRRQITWLGLALCAGAVAMFIDLEKIRPFIWILALSSLVLLIIVLIPGIGIRVNGAQRWLGFGSVRFQVSEFGKLGLIFLLAHYLAVNRRRMSEMVAGFFIPCTIIGLFCALIILEPDFGTALLCGVVGGTLLFLAGAKLRYLIPAGIGALALFAVAVWHDPVRLRRVTSFLDMEGTRSDASYQLWQGILAFGAGGLGGVGVGSGRQQMAFLPEAHTDFIFAIVGEELGFFFTAGVVALFLTIFLIGVIKLRNAPNLYQYLVVFGALIMLTFQALINIGVVTGCLPTKGISLPFISYGGSNLVFMFIFIGILLNGVRTWELPRAYRARDL